MSLGERLGISVRTTEAPLGVGVADLAGLAVRRNPKRVQLLVSRVLGKHIPTDPRLVYAAGRLLGLRAAEALGGCPPGTAARFGPLLAAALGRPPCSDAASAFRDAVVAEPVDTRALGRPLVLGNAETATALGHSATDALRGADYLHSTRRAAPGLAPVGGYAEPHSHADQHLLQPFSPRLFDRADPLIIVDDELSTGVTALNTVAALHARWPRCRYVIAALIDTRSPEDTDRVAACARALGTCIEVVSLASGRVEVAPTAAQAAGPLLSEPPRPLPRAGDGRLARVDLGWPAGVADSGRHGVTPEDRDRLEAALPAVVERLAAALSPGASDGAGPVQVLGTEEFMYVPLRIAEALADALPVPVRYSTTTRSPVLAVDEPDYPIRTVLRFDSHDSQPGPRFAYNVGASQVVVLTDAPADTPALADGLLRQVSAVTGQVVLAVVPTRPPLPPPLRGPHFSSYHAREVGWLLTDLSATALEAPVEEREPAIQAGRAHYADSLPVEYRPSADYRRLFRAALEESAARVAHAVGVVTELVLAARGPGAVLVSLARAGTPIGILMRRWAYQAHGLDLPHYTMSIVRGRGIDTVALRYLAANHDPSAVAFVDGWTGKGAIVRELAAAVAVSNAALGTGFRPELAVLADPGECVEIFGTREDYLVPSACLNSTVSGLVSRTVLNDTLIGPGDFHGAKFYAELAGEDLSGAFLDAVSARFSEVAGAVARDWRVLAGTDRLPTWAGWRAVERICAEYRVADVNLVKPGVGETTRVLLRRVPWKVLARTGERLPHVRQLAAERGVPVEEVDGLPYACVGLIRSAR